MNPGHASSGASSKPASVAALLGRWLRKPTVRFADSYFSTDTHDEFLATLITGPARSLLTRPPSRRRGDVEARGRPWARSRQLWRSTTSPAELPRIARDPAKHARSVPRRCGKGGRASSRRRKWRSLRRPLDLTDVESASCDDERSRSSVTLRDRVTHDRVLCGGLPG